MKLVGALNPGGYLLLASSEHENPVVRRAWWARYVIRGARIHWFMGRHASLRVMEEFWAGDYLVTLCKRL